MKTCTRPRGRPALAAFLLALLGLASGCEDDPAAPAEPVPVKVTIRVTAVEVIASCEGTTGTTGTNPGEFQYGLLFSTSDTSIATEHSGGTFEGLAGDVVSLPDIVFEVTRVPPEDGSLYVRFQVTETDDGVSDLGMFFTTVITELTWPTGNLPEAFHSQVISGSARCSVEFAFSLKAERMTE